MSIVVPNTSAPLAVLLMDISGNTYVAGGVFNVSAGTTSNNLSQVVFSDSNGVSFGINASTVTASVSQTNQTVGFYGVGNTASASSTTLDARTVSFDGLGGATVGFSNGSIQISAPNSVPQLSQIQMLPFNNLSLTQLGNGTIAAFQAYGAELFSASRADVFVLNSVSTSSNSSWAAAVSFNIALYTRNGSTLSLASSGSQVYQFSDTGGASSGSISGLRRLSIPINVNHTGGDLWAAGMSITASTNTNWFTMQNVGELWGPNSQLIGLIGEASNASKQLFLGQGVYSVTSASMPSAMAFSDLRGLGSGSSTGAININMNFYNFTA